MEAVYGLLVAKLNYWIYVVLMVIGLWAVIVKKNLMKKIIGMNILQTAVILFFISIGAKRSATIPILYHHKGQGAHAIHASDYINPLPHVLMLTAIVVAVATLGVALAMAIKIYQRHGTLEEEEILRNFRSE